MLTTSHGSWDVPHDEPQRSPRRATDQRPDVAPARTAGGINFGLEEIREDVGEGSVGVGVIGGTGATGGAGEEVGEELEGRSGGDGGRGVGRREFSDDVCGRAGADDVEGRRCGRATIL